MALATAPDSRLAARVLPPALYRALTHLFGEGLRGCMLVGGTALAGYYAGHRRSDDLDIFAADAVSWRAGTLAVKALSRRRAVVEEQRTTSGFQSTTCRLDGHPFTVQIVLDANLFVVGRSIRAADGVRVADLPTLVKMKAATLVSRCAEKDLYDLHWLLRREPGLTPQQLMELGLEIDGGMNAEAVLGSLVGAVLRRKACAFSRTEGAGAVFRKVSMLRERLGRGFEKLAQGRPAPPIGELIRKLGSRRKNRP
ncbi:MAG: nucleotidyl transferase AbiEii/AbiGii toxin family protein [Planctomycetes bacterium]|nr:nucleotidyl transferase AbiEii/AbiGii toxin family protein [Planctomycetota bacterium]